MSFMIFFINRNTSDQENSDREPHTQSVSVCGLRPWANRHSV